MEMSLDAAFDDVLQSASSEEESMELKTLYNKFLGKYTSNYIPESFCCDINLYLYLERYSAFQSKSCQDLQLKSILVVSGDSKVAADAESIVSL